MSTVLGFVNDNVPSSICLGSLQDYQDCLGVVDYYLVVHPYDGSLLGRPELTVAMDESRV